MRILSDYLFPLAFGLPLAWGIAKLGNVVFQMPMLPMLMIISTSELYCLWGINRWRRAQDDVYYRG
jgi:hypothetical protein